MADQVDWVPLSVFIFFFTLVTVMGFFAARFGRQIIHWARQNAHYMLYALLGLLFLGICAVVSWALYRRSKGEPFMPRGEQEVRAV